MLRSTNAMFVDETVSPTSLPQRAAHPRDELESGGYENF